MLLLTLVLLSGALVHAATETVRDHELVPEDYFDLAAIYSCVAARTATLSPTSRIAGVKARKVTTPTLIHVGGADPRVPPTHSLALFRALFHYLEVPVELVVYPGEPHSLTTHENRLAKMKWDSAWFD
ncbi:MAG: prolyl oligopeptidase family serine peptidase [bacterium]